MSEQFEALGAVIIDADVIARALTLPGTPALIAITKRYSGAMLNAHGQLNRQKLRSIVFSEPKQKLWLEQLLHPLIRSSIVASLQQTVSTYHILCSPLLFETQQDKLVTHTLTVDVSVAIQFSRARMRDGSEPEVIRSIIDSQIDRSKRLDLSDFVINNEGCKKQTITAVQTMHEHFLSLT